MLALALVLLCAACSLRPVAAPDGADSASAPQSTARPPVTVQESYANTGTVADSTPAPSPDASPVPTPPTGSAPLAAFVGAAGLILICSAGLLLLRRI